MGSVCFNQEGVFSFFSDDCNNCNLNKQGACENCYNMYYKSLRHEEKKKRDKESKMQQKADENEKLVEGFKKQINAMKSKIARRDVKVKSYEDLLESEHSCYLLELLSIAIKEEKLKETQFFYQLMENTLENIVHGNKSNSFRYRESIIHWTLLLPFYGGSKIWKALKDNDEKITSFFCSLTLKGKLFQN